MAKEIRFIKNCDAGVVGQVKNYSNPSADSFVEQGYAEYIKEEKKFFVDTTKYNWLLDPNRPTEKTKVKFLKDTSGHKKGEVKFIKTEEYLLFSDAGACEPVEKPIPTEKAFEWFEEVDALPTVEEKHRAVLKQYEGLNYSEWKDGKKKTGWAIHTPYKDEFFSPTINVAQRMASRIVLEFDKIKGKPYDLKGEFEKLRQTLEHYGIGYILSTHKSENTDYLWVEFTRDITHAEADNFIKVMGAAGTKIDINFARDTFLFPVLYAEHHKNSAVREMPIKHFKGRKIDLDSLKMPKPEGKESTTRMADGFEYKTFKAYSESEYEDALQNFKDKNLLKLVWDELSKTHIRDDELKMTTFLVCVSSLLKNQKLRMSMDITGNSSEGKDNEIKTCLKHTPSDAFIFLTSGTQAAIEDDIQDKRIIAFSEVNAGRENGANKYLIEIIKQKTEGGTSSMKKDIRDGMKTSRHEKGEQCTVIFGTTESNIDEEMATRFIKGTIENDPIRIKKVNHNTLDTISDLDKMLSSSNEEDSWLRIGLTYFFNQEEQPEVYIPYAKYLKELVGGKEIFDHNNARSQRDIKRVLALTCAMTYLHQEQREIIEYNGHKVLVSEPQDLINTLKISMNFFNQSYTGLDIRLTKVQRAMAKLKLTWIARDDIQREMDVSTNTIKGYCSTLESEGYLEGISGKDLNFKQETKIYHSNKVYYRRCQKGIKKQLIRCQLEKLIEFLKDKTKKPLIPFEFTCNSDDKKTEKPIKNKPIKTGQKVSDPKKPVEKEGKSEKNAKIDTFSLTPLKVSIENCPKCNAPMVKDKCIAGCE